MHGHELEASDSSSRITYAFLCCNLPLSSTLVCIEKEGVPLGSKPI